MLLREVGYARPESLAEAIELLAANDGARALAGGQTLVNVMKARAASPDALVDLERARRAEGHRPRRRRRARDRRDDDVHRRHRVGRGGARPILAEVCAQIADVQVRNRGTIGGNICSNDPTNHLPPLMVALGATMTIAGAGGERDVRRRRLLPRRLHDGGRPGRAADEDHGPGRQGDGFASVTIGGDGTCIVSAAAQRERRRSMSRSAASTQSPLLDPARLGRRARGARRRSEAAIDPPSDVHASSDYRRHLAEVVAVRAVARQRKRS